MTQEQYFPAGDDQVLGDRYVSTAVNMTMLRDHLTAAPFLARVAAEEPDLAPGLASAIACYDEVGRLQARLNAIISDDFSPEAMQAIADPAQRQASARGILEIRDREEEAVVALEGLLEQLSRGEGAPGR